MNLEQRKAYFESLIDKKIAWSGWFDTDLWLITSSNQANLNYTTFKAITCSQKLEKYVTADYNFNLEENSGSWIVVEEEKQKRNTTSEKQNQKHKCTCDIRDIMTYGCKCGGI